MTRALHITFDGTVAGSDGQITMVGAHARAGQIVG